jgi:hypothetical protein
MPRWPGHSRPQDGVASLAYSRPQDGIASLAYGRPQGGVASLVYVSRLSSFLAHRLTGV